MTNSKSEFSAIFQNYLPRLHKKYQINVHLLCKMSCQRCRAVVTKLPTLNMVGGCRYN